MIERFRTTGGGYRAARTLTETVSASGCRPLIRTNPKEATDGNRSKHFPDRSGTDPRSRCPRGHERRYRPGDGRLDPRHRRGDRWLALAHVLVERGLMGPLAPRNVRAPGPVRPAARRLENEQTGMRGWPRPPSLVPSGRPRSSRSAWPRDPRPDVPRPR